MRIVQIAAIEMTHIKLLKALNESSVAQGFEVHCVSTFGTQQNEVKNQGVYYHDIQIDRKINPINNVKAIFQMVKLFKEIKPDLVHVHTPVAAVLGRIAAKIAGVPTIIYTAHGFYFHEGMSLRSINSILILKNLLVDILQIIYSHKVRKIIIPLFKIIF
ncbi:glycosyltransferase [Staphylococcus equorum]|uniref:glycosyltransferase n=1 Tax=Staphylococcus equorum TaxID=246432 RepID=UPI001F53EDE6|nr:glycosyltransferase [Staphylococcus equorum]